MRSCQLKYKKTPFCKWFVVISFIISTVVMYEGLKNVVIYNLIDRETIDGLYKRSNDKEMEYIFLKRNQATITSLEREDLQHIIEDEQTSINPSSWNIYRTNNQYKIVLKNNKEKDKVFIVFNDQLISKEGDVYQKIK